MSQLIQSVARAFGFLLGSSGRPQPARILIALVAGLSLGVALAAWIPGRALSAADNVQPVGTIWLHALQMTIVPLVVSLLITGIAATAERARAGKLAGRAFVTFIVLLWISSALGGALTLLYLDIFPLASESAAALQGALAQKAPEIGEVPPFIDFLVAIVPSNPITAAASDAFLPLILFTTVFAFAITRLPAEERARLTGFFEALGNAMLVVINWVLWLGPIGVGALAYVVGARAGTAAFGALLHYIAILCGVGLVMWLLAVPFAAIAGRISPLRYIRAVAPSQAVAFSTQSSLASLPAMLRATEKLDVPVAHSGVVLPVAVAIFRWTGPAMNFAVAIYVAHLLGMPLGPSQLAAGWAAAAITTMGAVGLPGTISFVSSIAPIAIAMGVPIPMLGLLVAVETIPDIFRTLGNVAMDVAATRTVSTRTGGAEELRDESDALLGDADVAGS
jgi:proton glutamate symport protein